MVANKLYSGNPLYAIQLKQEMGLILYCVDFAKYACSFLNWDCMWFVISTSFYI